MFWPGLHFAAGPSDSLHHIRSPIGTMFRIIALSCAVAICFPLVAIRAAKKENNNSRPKFELAEAATPADRIQVPPGFKVELLYSVPKEEEGSWVNICYDPKGRLIVCDQYGGLYRVTPPAIGSTAKPKIEKVPVELGMAQGLLWAFDSLYVMVNSPEREKNGLYRVRDTDGDDQLDTVEFLKNANGDGEHGPHGIVPSPDKKSLYVVCGNNTKPIEGATSRVPKIWDEDVLLPRIYGVGFMRGVPAPAGAIYNVSPDGKSWERVTSGFRNPFDIAFNADGELFTFDADMEWDIGAPFYRPTRVCHAVSGADWGWRNGSAKWPVYFADTLSPVVNIGPGSPTGITFGYSAKFPAKYQNALFICDWTFGKMYAIHLKPKGSSYTADKEEFMSATPLPFTDAIINPHDRAMYFLIGGRKTQSGLYRLTYDGKDSTAPVSGSQENTKERSVRRELETLHIGDHPEALEKAWPYLKHADRFTRYAARVAVEQRPLEGWQERALAESDPQASLTAVTALVRKIPRTFKPDGPDLDTPPPTFPADGAERHPLQPRVFAALAKLDWKGLSLDQQLELLRVYELALYRLGPPDEAARQALIKRLDGFYPAAEYRENVLLTELLCYLQAPSAAAKGMDLLAAAPEQESQIGLVKSLRFLKTGWNLELHRALFKWFLMAKNYRGGNNFPTYIQELKNDCLANTPDDERKALDAIINPKVAADAGKVSASRPVVKEWTMAEVLPLVTSKLHDRDFAKGKAMFAAANCYACHHFAGDGGAVGPDLTALAGRFSARDILESVLEPNKVISDQYAASVVTTLSGKVVTGRVTNLHADGLTINTNMLDPNATITVKRSDIDTMEPSKTSMMPSGLLNTLHEDELLDLMAFLLSRGDAKNPMFKQQSAADTGNRSGVAQ
jgi:putative heme-binding domain-containing protein